MFQVFTITAVAHMRSEPEHKAELISQLLFGETAYVFEQKNDFYRLKSASDNYIGWVHKNQVTAVDETKVQTLKNYYTQFQETMISINGKEIVVPFGSKMYVATNSKLQLNETYSIEFTLANEPENSGDDQILLQHAYTNFRLAYKSTSYLWGGKSALGIDCSGLVQQFFKLVNVNLPRDAKDQAMQGVDIGFLQEVKPFDVAFFDDEEGNIIHTGILLSTTTILHAYGSVREDVIDVAGIIHADTKQRTHKLRCIKRFI